MTSCGSFWWAGELVSSYHVLQAVDGEAGWALVQTELPDIVLTDVMMPRLDGIELTRLMKSHADTDHIAVVMLTAKAAPRAGLTGCNREPMTTWPNPLVWMNCICVCVT
ncbi:response regulator [Spirosoma jeollabukense]